MQDLIGKQIGDYVAIDAYRDTRRNIIWTVKCVHCGKLRKLDNYLFLKGATHYCHKPKARNVNVCSGCVWYKTYSFGRCCHYCVETHKLRQRREDGSCASKEMR